MSDASSVALSCSVGNTAEERLVMCAGVSVVEVVEE